MRRTLLLAVAGTLWACNPPCETGGVGALDLSVSGLPEGTGARVELSGPDTLQTATAAGKVSDLPSGSYTVTPLPVALPGGIIRSAYGGSAATTVCVPNDGTAGASVTYSLIPSSAKLWLTTNKAGAEVPGFAAPTLGVSSTIPASVKFASDPAITSARGVAFDAVGNLWVAEASGRIRRYAATGLGTGTSTRTPDVVLSGTHIGGGSPGPTELAFDASGNLWVTIAFNKRVLRFSRDELAMTGAPSPSVELSSFTSPSALAFDAAGNLWVGDGTRIVRFDAAALAATSTAPPSLRVTVRREGPTSNVLTAPDGLAFDAAGNLWVAFFAPNIIARLTPADLSGAGDRNVSDATKIELSVSGLLHGLAFDEEGHLWTPYTAGNVGRISPAQLAAGGVVTPDILIASPDLGSAEVLAIYPAPAGTPLFHRLP